MNAEIQKLVEDLLVKTDKDEVTWRVSNVDTRIRTYRMRYHGLDFALCVRSDIRDGKELSVLVYFAINEADIVKLVDSAVLCKLVPSVVLNQLRYIVRTYNDTEIGAI